MEAQQLTMWEMFATSTANQLLALLNSGRKNKDCFYPQYYFEEGEYVVFIAAVVKDNKIVFNIVDKEGNIPDGFSANWRSMQHVLHELKIDKFTDP